jgi:hypothetical protein
MNSSTLTDTYGDVEKLLDIALEDGHADRTPTFP